jgi:hypothetical protein
MATQKIKQNNKTTNCKGYQAIIMSEEMNLEELRNKLLNDSCVTIPSFSNENDYINLLQDIENPKLKQIKFSPSNSINDVVAYAIATFIENNPNFSHLVIRYTNIGNKGIEKIIDSFGNREVYDLSFEHSPNITEIPDNIKNLNQKYFTVGLDYEKFSDDQRKWYDEQILKI